MNKKESNPPPTGRRLKKLPLPVIDPVMGISPSRKSLARDSANYLCERIIFLGFLGIIGWFLYNIFGPSANQFSFMDAGILVVIMAIFGYAATKR